jgi:hypothetical protein
MQTAPELLKSAAETMEERAAQYDSPQGERSMGKAVSMFNIATGNCPCMRPYHDNDREHLGAAHRMSNAT